MATIEQDLKSLADPDYQAFHSKLIPNIDPSCVLGVRSPVLRKYAKEFAKAHRDEAYAFMQQLPHAYYEENNLHGELIGLLAKTTEEAFTMLDSFLPYVNNWATCDLIRVGAFKKDLSATLNKIKEWIASDPEYMVRFGIVQLMILFLDEAFEPEHLQIIASIQREEYYINMARAWYYSFALIKQPEATVPFFEKRPVVLDTWTYNKSLQKARESRRISSEQKAYFQSLKIKQASC